MAPSSSDSAAGGSLEKSGKSDASGKSLTAAEAEIEATRERLAQTIDALIDRTSPRNVVRREVEGVKGFFVDPQGNPRTENILKVAAGVLGVVGVVVVIRRVTR